MLCYHIVLITKVKNSIKTKSRDNDRTLTATYFTNSPPPSHPGISHSPTCLSWGICESGQRITSHWAMQRGAKDCKIPRRPESPPMVSPELTTVPRHYQKQWHQLWWGHDVTWILLWWKLVNNDWKAVWGTGAWVNEVHSGKFSLQGHCSHSYHIWR